MLYILLIIIAVGVLLASETGQKLLGLLGILAMIGGLLYLGFWVVVIVIGLLSDESIKDTIFVVVGAIMLTVYVIYIAHKVYKGFKNGNYSIQSMGRSIKSKFIKAWKRDRTNKTFIIILSLFFLFIALSWLYSFIIYE